MAKPNVATRIAGLRLSSAEAERLSETRLLNHTLKDNVQKKTDGKLEILPNLEWSVIIRKWQLLK